MRILKVIILVSICLLLASSSRPVLAAEVVQGKCLAFDEAGHTMTLENEIDQAQVVFDLTLAKIGLVPEPGDVIRVAYKVDGSKNMAIKVMNVTKQNLRKE